MQTTHTQDQPETHANPKEANNLAPFKIIVYKLFHSKTEKAYIFERHAYIADNFRITYITRGKSEFTSTIFLMIPVAWLALFTRSFSLPEFNRRYYVRAGFHCIKILNLRKPPRSDDMVYRS